MRPELVPEEHTKHWIAKRDRSRNATEPRCLKAATKRWTAERDRSRNATKPRRLKAAINGRRARNSEPDRSSIPIYSKRKVILSCFMMKESGAQS
jgi:hypothetical protein